MEALYILVPLSVVLVFISIWVFLSMSDGGQFDDMVGPAMRVVLDDDRAEKELREDKDSSHSEQESGQP